MKVIEQFTQGKRGDPSLNEDRLVITPDFIAALDGVTTRLCPPIDGRSAGRFAVDAAEKAIHGFAPDITARAAIDLLTQSLRAAVAEKASLAAHVEHPAFALAAYSRHRREVWRVADPWVVLDGATLGEPLALDRISAETRALMIETALAKGATAEEVARRDAVREFVLPVHKEQHIFANRPGPFGYGVINGGFVPDAFIEVIDAARAREIALLSDGYPQAFPTLAASEAHLAALLREDPLLYRKYRSTKGLHPPYVSFDDRTYVRFSV